MPMKVSDANALLQAAKVQEAAKRLDIEDIKGVTVQVIFDGGRPGAETPQVFFAEGTPEFDAVMQQVRGKIAAVAAEADAKVAELSAKISNGTVDSTPVVG